MSPKINVRCLQSVLCAQKFMKYSHTDLTAHHLPLSNSSSHSFKSPGDVIVSREICEGILVVNVMGWYHDFVKTLLQYLLPEYQMPEINTEDYCLLVVFLESLCWS